MARPCSQGRFVFDARPHLLSSPLRLHCVSTQSRRSQRRRRTGEEIAVGWFRFSGWPAGKSRRRFLNWTADDSPSPGREGRGEGERLPQPTLLFHRPFRDVIYSSRQRGTLSPANFRCRSATGLPSELSVPNQPGVLCRMSG